MGMGRCTVLNIDEDDVTNRLLPTHSPDSPHRLVFDLINGTA